MQPTHRGLLHHLIIAVANVSRSSPFYATFFADPDGLRYEFVINPNHRRRHE